MGFNLFMDKIKWIIYKITHPLFRLYWRIFKPKTYGSRGIILYGENILLVKNINVNYWSLPGGKIDKGETSEECLFRELKEELSISVSKIDFKLGEYISNKEGKRDTVYIFVVKLLSSNFQKQWELQEAKWFPLSYLPKDLSPATSRRIIEFKAGNKNLVCDW